MLGERKYRSGSVKRAGFGIDRRWPGSRGVSLSYQRYRAIGAAPYEPIPRLDGIGAAVCRGDVTLGWSCPPDSYVGGRAPKMKDGGLGPLCLSCRRFAGFRSGVGMVCEAFGEDTSIPIEIAVSSASHRDPFPGDGGLTYQPTDEDDATSDQDWSEDSILTNWYGARP